MNFLKRNNNLEKSVKEAISWIVNIQKSCDGFSKINIVITNGNELIATRFVSKAEKSLSLNYFFNSKNENQISALTLSSESLDDDNIVWHELPENHYIYLNKNNMQIKIEQL